MTVRQLGENMTSSEITQWYAYYSVQQKERESEQKKAEKMAKAKQMRQPPRTIT